MASVHFHAQQKSHIYPLQNYEQDLSTAYRENQLEVFQEILCSDTFQNSDSAQRLFENYLTLSLTSRNLAFFEAAVQCGLEPSNKLKRDLLPLTMQIPDKDDHVNYIRKEDVNELFHPQQSIVLKDLSRSFAIPPTLQKHISFLDILLKSEWSFDFQAQEALAKKICNLNMVIAYVCLQLFFEAKFDCLPVTKDDLILWCWDSNLFGEKNAVLKIREKLLALFKENHCELSFQAQKKIRLKKGFFQSFIDTGWVNRSEVKNHLLSYVHFTELMLRSR